MSDPVQLDLSFAIAEPILTWQDAERLGQVLMLALGFADAHLTNPGTDAGIDVVSRDGVCQVKHWATQVGRREVQQLAGAASGRQAVFLATRYSIQALSWANGAGVALFSFDRSSVVSTVNPSAVTLALRFALPDLTDSESRLAGRLARANRWFAALITELERLRSERALKRRYVKRNAKKVSRFEQRLPELQRQFARVGATTTLKVAPSARLNQRLRKLEDELRSAARALEIRLPD